MTAAFAGAPAVAFTTFGAAPNRDGVMLGFNATTAIAERISLFVRYEGEVAATCERTIVCTMRAGTRT